MPTELSIEEGADEAAQIRSKENTATDNIESTNQTTNTTTNTNTTTVTDQDHAAERNSMEIQNDEMTSSTTSSNGSSSINGFTKRTSITAPDPTAYVTKARITRPAPPAPSYNPMQFVQIKPCNLYQTAQEQLKKADEVKKLKEIKKEEPEEWQNNLDNWKSSRRKHVEHIIDRVVETKKLQLEEHDRMRRKSKTFSEMIEERAERSGSRSRVKLVSLAIYNEDEANDLSDLGIGTSSASGKSSLSEDYDNNSVMSDNATELEKPINDEKVEENKRTHSTNREYISSPGYDTSSSTAPASSPEPCEYTYEGAIQDYKQRVSRAAVSGSSLTKLTPSHASNDTAKKEHNSKDSTSEHGKTNGLNYRPRQSNTLEERLSGFSLTTTVIEQQTTEAVEKPKVDLPKIDISKRKEIFESQKSLTESKSNSALFSKSGVTSNGMPPRVTLRERFVVEIDDSATMPPAKIEVRRMSGDITSIRDRLQSLEQQKNALNGTKGLDVPVPPLKQRLSSLQNAVTKDEIRKPPVMLVDERQLEIMKNEEEIAKRRQTKHRDKNDAETKPIPKPISAAKDEDIKATTPAQQHNENNIAKTATVANTTPPAAAQLGVEQEQQLNAAIAALALEEQQLEAAASVVNQIEAEFAELTDLNPAPLACKSVAVASTTNEQSHDDMEFSINEALESALEAIDKEAGEAATATLATNVEKETNAEESEACTASDVADNVNEMRKDQTTIINRKQPTDKEELFISNEPIYENVSVESTQNVDANLEANKAIIIPQTIKNNNNNIQINNKKDINNRNNNKRDENAIILNDNNGLLEYETMKATTAEAGAGARTNTATTTTTIPKNRIMEKQQQQEELSNNSNNNNLLESYYQVPKSNEPYYDAPKPRRPAPVYENIDLYYSEDGDLLEFTTPTAAIGTVATAELTTATRGPLLPPKEKPPPPPIETKTLNDELAMDGADNTENWSSSENNSYELISRRTLAVEHPSPPIKRMNSTKRIKKELRNKRSSFLGIESGMDDEESYLELNVAPPPNMVQLLQEERRLEKQLYIKAGLCDSSDTAESRDSGVSENHSRQSSEHYTNSSEENDALQNGSLSSHNHTATSNEKIYQNDALLTTTSATATAKAKAAVTTTPTPLLQTVKGNSAESWTQSATEAAAASQSLSEATATANAKMLSIEEKIREQEEVLRVERELLHYSQGELKRQRENLLLRENLARRELQQGAKIMLAANRRSLQDLHGLPPIYHDRLSNSSFQPNKMSLQQIPTILQRSMLSTTTTTTAATAMNYMCTPRQQQIYANIPNLQRQYYPLSVEYRKSMSDLNEITGRLTLPAPPPVPPTKPLRAIQAAAVNGYERQTNGGYSGGSLIKIASQQLPTAAPRTNIYTNYHQHEHNHQSIQNLSPSQAATQNGSSNDTSPTKLPSSNGATAQQGNMTRNALLALSATPKPKYTDGWVQVQNRKSYDTKLSNDPAWISAQQHKRKSMPETALYNDHWLVQEAEQRRRITNACALTKFPTSNSNSKPLPDSIIQTLTERVQSRGIGERQRFDSNYNHRLSNVRQHTQTHQQATPPIPSAKPVQQPASARMPSNKFSHVNGKKKCAHCGDELGQGSAMIIESLLLFYHIGCFKCCVCHVQLGDGLNGADVRVRNNQLHCQNCFSSDDGSKFSCV